MFVCVCWGRCIRKDFASSESSLKFIFSLGLVLTPKDVLKSKNFSTKNNIRSYLFQGLISIMASISEIHMCIHHEDIFMDNSGKLSYSKILNF